MYNSILVIYYQPTLLTTFWQLSPRLTCVLRPQSTVSVLEKGRRPLFFISFIYSSLHKQFTAHSFSHMTTDELKAMGFKL